MEGGSDVWRESGREAGAGRSGEWGAGGRATSGTGVKGKEAKFVWEEEESCEGWQGRMIQEQR